MIRKNQVAILSTLIAIIVVAIIILAGVFIYQNYIVKSQQPEPVACTMEAKLCPDGSAVGREGPNCEFKACPAVDQTVEQSCLVSGGKISEATCYCNGVQDFYNSCVIGACGCPPDPQFKKEVKFCDCGEGKCWDGTKCATLSGQLDMGSNN